MKKQSFMRDMKRKAMRRNRTRFTDRVTEAIRTGTLVKSISFRVEKPPVDVHYNPSIQLQNQQKGATH